MNKDVRSGLIRVVVCTLAALVAGCGGGSEDGGDAPSSIQPIGSDTPPPADPPPDNTDTTPPPPADDSPPADDPPAEEDDPPSDGSAGGGPMEDLEGLPPGTLSLVHWKEDRANNDFFDSKLSLPFANRGGDWRDAFEQPNGDAPFAMQEITTSGYWQEVDVSDLVWLWVNGEHINKGFLLKQFGGRGTKIASKESANPPRLVMQLLDGSDLSFEVLSDTFVDTNETGARGDKDFVDISGSRNGFLRFAISEIDPAQFHSARLQLYITSKSGTDGGFEVYRCSQGGNTSQPDLGAPLVGLAAGYANDVNIAAHPDVVHSEKFETDDWVDHFEKNGHQRFVMIEGRNALVSSDTPNQFVPLDGQALKATIAQGTHDGISAFYNFENRIGYQPEEVYFRYYLRFGDTWDSTYNGKLPGIAHKGFDGEGVPSANGQSPSYGENTWSARGLFEPPELEDLGPRMPIGFYTYHTDQALPSGEHFVWSNNYQGFLEKNRWYSVEQYIKMNTPGNDDGIMRAWIDGQLAYENVEINLTNNPDFKIRHVWLNLYHGGFGPGEFQAPADISIFIDNLVIAKSYIGPASME